MGFMLSIANDDSEWDALVNTSPQGSIFLNSSYLRSLGVPFNRFLVRRPHGEVLGGFAVMEDEKMHAMHDAPFPFAPYQGIMFSSIVVSQPTHKRVVTEFRLTEFIIHGLIERYGDFKMALSPSFNDLRPFLWHNFHKPEAPHFIIRNRYTAILDLSGWEKENYLRSIRAVRRQEFKKSSAEIIESTDIEQFISLYTKTFGRQGIAVSDVKLALIRRISNSALSNGYGRLSMASTEHGVASMALFVYDNRCAYYLFGANDPELRYTWGSIKLMVDNIGAMAKRGLTQLDFIGVNSPNRGDFKLSFNPELTPYHEVTLESG